MNFDAAIALHAKWKMMLRSYVAKPDGSLNPAIVADDQNCDLGKWIAGEGRKFASLPEYSTLASSHARFHKAAGDVIRRADAGEDMEMEIAPSGRSEFLSASSGVVQALMDLKNEAKP